MVTDCEKCGTQRLNHTWATVDFVSMARATGANTGSWLGPAYYEPLNYVHATAAALGKFFQAEGEVMTLKGVHREEAHHALLLGHYLLLNGLDLLREPTNNKDLEVPVKKACEAYEVTWGLKPPPEGDGGGV